MRIRRVLVATLVLSGCSRPESTPATATTVSGARIASAPPNSNAGEWLLPGRDYSNSRYSELSQITPANAKDLRVAWKIETPFEVLESNATRREGKTLIWEYDLKSFEKMTPQQQAEGIRAKLKM